MKTKVTPQELLALMSDDVKCIAMDEDKNWYSYPSLNIEECSKFVCWRGEGAEEIGAFSIDYSGDWKDSKTVRPAENIEFREITLGQEFVWNTYKCKRIKATFVDPIYGYYLYADKLHRLDKMAIVEPIEVEHIAGPKWIDFTQKSKAEFEEWVVNKNVTIKSRGGRPPVKFLRWTISSRGLAVFVEAGNIQHDISYRKIWKEVES